MAADGLIKAAGDQQTLVRPRATPNGCPQQGGDLSQAWTQIISGTGRSKYCSARRAFGQISGLHEAASSFDPTCLRHRASAKEHQPGGSRTGGRRSQARAKWFGRTYEPAACKFSYLGSCIARRRISDYGLREQPGSGTRYQRSQRRYERSL